MTEKETRLKVGELTAREEAGDERRSPFCQLSN